MVVLVCFYCVDLSDLIHRCVSVFVLLCVLVACFLDIFCVCGGGGGGGGRLSGGQQRRHIKIIQICFIVVDNISTFSQFDGFFIGRLAYDAQYIYTLGIVFYWPQV